MSARRDGPEKVELPVMEASRTQRIPAGMIRASSSLHVSVVGDGSDSDADHGGDESDFGEATTPSLARPQIVVMEERPGGLVEALTTCGFHVRRATSGLEAMSLVAQHQVVAVVVAPGDAERRRVLTVAVRQHHRHVAVIHVLARIDDASKRAAMIVGASGVLSWPLPPIEQVLAVIPQSALTAASSSLAPFAEHTAEVPLLSADASAINSDDAATHLVQRAKSSSDVFAASPSSSSANVAKATRFASRVRIPVDKADGDDAGEEVATAPRLRPAPQSLAEPVAADVAADDLVTLLAGVPELVGVLEGSAAFLEALQMHHVRGADGHARAIHQAVQLLTRLYTRLDGVDLDG